MAVERWHWDDDPTILSDTLARGGVLAIPTESSYGLAVSPRDEAATQAVLRIKRRSGSVPLPVVIADIAQAEELGVDLDAPGLARVLRHWPAALSVIVDTKVALPAGAGASTLAIRVPGHRRLRGLLRRLATPLTATSANRSRASPIRDPAQLSQLLADADSIIVDDGVLPGGPPSTLVRWSLDSGRFDVLRDGAYPAELLGDP